MEVIEHHTGRQAEPTRTATATRSLTAALERLLQRRGVSRVIMFGAVLLTALAWWAARGFAASDAQQRFERRSDDIHRRIAYRMAAYETMLQGNAGLLAAEPGASRGAWKRYVEMLDPTHRLPGIQAVGLSRLMTGDEVPALEQAVRAEGYGNFAVRPPAIGREEYSSIVYIEPLEGRNLRAFGFDMLTEPVRREAMLRALSTGRAALSGTVTLMQEDGQDVQQGMLLYLPVYREPLPGDAGGASARKPMGWVYAAFRVKDLMHGIFGDEAQDLAFTLRDGDAEAPFYDSSAHRTAQAASAVALPVGEPRLSRTLEVAGRHWTADYVDLSEGAAAGARSANLVAACGLTIDLLLFWSLSATARRRVQAEARVAQLGDEARTRLDWLTAVSGLSPDAILVFRRGQDDQWRLVFSNPAFSDWFGLRPEDLEGLSEPAVGEWLDGLAHDDNPQPLLAPCEATVTLAGPPARVLRRGMREDGRQRVYYYRDITRETEVDRLKNEFLTTAAHELRTPLASVYGFSELLVHNRVDAARMARTVGIIHRQAGVLNHLVNELLDLARIDSRGDSDFQRERTDLRGVAEAAAETMLRPDEPSRIQLELGSHACWARIDGTKTRQALVNVLSNALKYSAQDAPVTLAIAESRQDGVAGAAVVVRDQGIGMTAEQCERAFERFYRADPSGHILGAGLGLAITKNIVELQGGRILLDSAVGVGTTVTLWWPLDTAEDAPAEPAVKAEELAEA